MTDANFDDDAARWFLLHQAGGMTRGDRKAFDRWLSHAPEARHAYRHAERMWRLAGTARGDAVPLPAASADRGWRRHRGRWAAGTIAACAAMLAVALPGPIHGFIDVQLAPVRGGGQVLSTAAARRTATLADGSVVTLDSGTRLRVLEMGARRRIELLAGHAFFRVAKDPAHPFLVTAMNKTVHAIGTAFDVRMERDAVAVTLVEGKVRVDQSRGLLRDPIATDMTPGRRLVASDDHVWLMSPVDPMIATAWLDGRLTYSRGTVGRIVADVNAGATRKIVFQGPIDEDQRIVGVFERGDTESLATILEVKGIARVVARDEETIEMQPIAR